MKKIFNILIAFVTLQVSALTMFGQTKLTDQERDRLYYKDNGSGICYSKTISEPDNNGVYTITLESFVTGNVTIEMEDQPVDVVLVLDVSGSMADQVGGVTKMSLLQDAVKKFIDIIYYNAIYEDWKEDEPRQKERETPLQNHIAIVKFASGRGNNTGYYNDNADAYEEAGTGNTRGNHTNSDNGYNYTEVVRGLKLVETNRADLKDIVGRLVASGATAADRGMKLAQNILNHDTNSKNSKVVVMFTDGEPNHGSGFTYSVARDAVNSANTIKNPTDASKKATIFTVGVFGTMGTNAKNRVDAYMDHMSSNYPSATATVTTSWGEETGIQYTGTKLVGADYYKQSSGSDLTSIFTQIAEASGGSGNSAMTSATSNVDIVSASFALPDGTTPETIKVYTAPCIGIQPGIVNADTTYTVTKKIGGVDTEVTEHWLKFGADTLSPNAKAKYEYIEEGKPNRWVDVDDSVSVSITGNLISVTGFNYSGNWCGYNESTKKYQGHKVIIEIPIEMASTAVGGVAIQTNEKGSGIYAKGSTQPAITFESPRVSLPINLHINKQGLAEGESARFIIERAIPGDGWTKPSDPSSPSYNNLDWKPVTTVFVTRHKGQDINDPITKVRGLPSENGAKQEYIYRIREDTNWAWSYGNHTIIRGIYTSDQLITNPFIFNNVKKDGIDYKIRHAESKATNTFNENGGHEYDDSKDNKRQVIIVTTPPATEEE